MSGDGLCSKSNSQSNRVKRNQTKSGTEHTVQRTATRVQDCEINPFRPTEPQNHTKKELTRRQASHFLQLVPGLPCVVGPGLPSNQVECVVLSIIPCVCKEPDFPFTWDGVDGADGADGAWQTDRLLTSTASVRLRFPENSIIELNHALFMGCRAIASPLHPDCKYSNLTPYGVPKAKQTDRDRPVHVPERSGFYDRRDCDLRLWC